MRRKEPRPYKGCGSFFHLYAILKRQALFAEIHGTCDMSYHSEYCHRKRENRKPAACCRCSFASVEKTRSEEAEARKSKQNKECVQIKKKRFPSVSSTYSVIGEKTVDITYAMKSVSTRSAVRLLCVIIRRQIIIRFLGKLLTMRITRSILYTVIPIIYVLKSRLRRFRCYNTT